MKIEIRVEAISLISWFIKVLKVFDSIEGFRGPEGFPSGSQNHQHQKTLKNFKTIKSQLKTSYTKILYNITTLFNFIRTYGLLP